MCGVVPEYGVMGSSWTCTILHLEFGKGRGSTLWQRQQQIGLMLRGTGCGRGEIGNGAVSRPEMRMLVVGVVDTGEIRLQSVFGNKNEI